MNINIFYGFGFILNGFGYNGLTRYESVILTGYHEKIYYEPINF